MSALTPECELQKQLQARQAETNTVDSDNDIDEALPLEAFDSDDDQAGAEVKTSKTIKDGNAINSHHQQGAGFFGAAAAAAAASASSDDDEIKIQNH